MSEPTAAVLAPTGTDAVGDPRFQGAGLAPRSDVWRGRRSVAPVPATATGFPVLDALLPGQGWPVGGLCEVLHPWDGVGELALVLPALARLAGDALRPVVWVAPPYQPFAPALREHGIELAHLRVIQATPQQALWAAEQCLRAGCCAAVLVWPQRIDGTALRRLQLAAETGRCHAFVFRDARHAGDASPAPLRLAVRREHGQPVIRVVKCRGLLAPPAHELPLEMVPGTISSRANIACLPGALASVPDTAVAAKHATVAPMVAMGPGTHPPGENPICLPTALSSLPDAAAATKHATVASVRGTAAPPSDASSADAAAHARTPLAHRYACVTRPPSLQAVVEPAPAGRASHRPGAAAERAAGTGDDAGLARAPSP